MAVAVSSSRLAIATGRAFGELMRATTPLAGSEANRRLRLSISSTFVTAWLVPRIAGFMASHPEIELSIENSNRLLDLENEPFDAGIRAGDGNWPGLVAQHLMDLDTHAVRTCSPVSDKC